MTLEDKKRIEEIRHQTRPRGGNIDFLLEIIDSALSENARLREALGKARAVSRHTQSENRERAGGH